MCERIRRFAWVTASNGEPTAYHSLHNFSAWTVAKRKLAPYAPDAGWRKVLNPDYTQRDGRHEFFNRSSTNSTL